MIQEDLTGSVGVQWPADKVERRSVASLVPYARNARTHSPEQIGKIAASIREFGWTIPVLVDEDNTLIAGHGRIMAAQKLGLETVPVMVARGWSEAQRRAYVIADNQLALDAGWNDELLKLELLDLQNLDFDLSLTGFDEAALNNMLADPEPDGTEGLTDPDEAPEVQAEAISKPGDVWLLGRHRIVCGDCTDPLVVEKALNGVKPHLMCTDPPYGVEYDASFRNGIKRANGSIVSARAVGKVLNDDRADWREAWALFPGDVAYVWHAGKYAGIVQESLEACDFEIRSQIIWAKSNFAISRGNYHWQHEPAWYCVRKGANGHWNGDRSQTTLWQIPKPAKSETGHSTQKPVECMLRPIQNNSSPGQAVYEPFSGSGTTLIACEQSGRACHAVELNPLYVDVAVRRWMAFTGQTATLEATGEPFPAEAATTPAPA